MKVVLLVLFDGLLVFAVVMVLRGEDRSGPAGLVAGAVAAVLGNLLLLPSVFELPALRRERRQVREALAGGTAVGEQIEATAAVRLTCQSRGWYLLEVGGGRLLSQREGDLPFLLQAPGELAEPACFEVVWTRRHRLPLGKVAHGLSPLPVSPPLDLAAWFPDAAEQQRLLARLEARPSFPGCLTNLPEALNRLLQTEPAPDDGWAREDAVAVQPLPASAAWAALHTAIEEQFGIAFGPGGLAAALTPLPGTRARSPTARDLLDIVLRELPPDKRFAVRPIRPAFYRLRAALEAEWAVPRQCVRPSTRLEDLSPQANRAEPWQRLSQRLGQPLPPEADRQLPISFYLLGALGILLLYVVGVPTVQAIDGYALAHGFEKAWWFRLLGVCLVPTTFWGGMALSFVLAAYLTRNHVTLRFRAKCNSVGDLARFLAKESEEKSVPWTVELGWLALRRLVATAVQKRPFEVSLEARLTEGLGFGS